MKTGKSREALDTVEAHHPFLGHASYHVIAHNGLPRQMPLQNSSADLLRGMSELSDKTSKYRMNKCRPNAGQATLTPPHATLCPVFGAFVGASPAAVGPPAPVVVGFAALGGMGSGMCLRSS